MNKAIAVPSRTKEILEKYQLRAKKNYGQNFLVDPVIVERCAKESHCEGAVIEIGPGIGSLTEQLAKYSRHVLAYEIDDRLIPVLREELKECDNIEIRHQDFLECDLDAETQALRKEYGTVSVCANLPYYITSQVLFKIFDNNDISCITVMVQKEVGERFAAKPGESEYSALSAEAQYLYDVKKLFTVPGRSFNPSPNVDSVIIQLERKEKESEEDVKDFFAFIRACFKQRRKTIYNNLKEYLQDGELVKNALLRANVDPGCRAQELDAEILKKIYEACGK